jgi:hypothetical protein
LVAADGGLITPELSGMLDIQYGRAADDHGWVHRLGMSRPRPAVSHRFASRRGL